MEYIDFHSHILPGVDDGAQSLEMSGRMLSALLAQNVKAVVLTPHYYSDSISLADFVRQRDEALRHMLDGIDSEIPTLFPAAETYISKYIFGNDDLTPVCIGKSRKILLELPFGRTITSSLLDMVYKVIVDYDVEPILAHVERYTQLLHDEYVFDELLDMGCMAQINLGSLDSTRSVRKKMFKLIEAGKISVVGTDCHNMTTRPPDYRTGITLITEKFGESCVEEMMSNAREILCGS